MGLAIMIKWIFERHRYEGRENSGGLQIVGSIFKKVALKNEYNVKARIIPAVKKTSTSLKKLMSKLGLENHYYSTALPNAIGEPQRFLCRKHSRCRAKISSV